MGLDRFVIDFETRLKEKYIIFLFFRTFCVSKQEENIFILHFCCFNDDCSVIRKKYYLIFSNKQCEFVANLLVKFRFLMIIIKDTPPRVGNYVFDFYI
jgi:hypothetical protein